MKGWIITCTDNHCLWGPLVSQVVSSDKRYWSQPGLLAASISSWDVVLHVAVMPRCEDRSSQAVPWWHHSRAEQSPTDSGLKLPYPSSCYLLFPCAVIITHDGFLCWLQHSLQHPMFPVFSHNVESLHKDVSTIRSHHVTFCCMHFSVITIISLIPAWQAPTASTVL